ncbi:MAG: RNA-binding protein [Candidatus Daviesbacteria bacterium]|nr:RNA-binding protein [Candidatus Daviesbacteria bacterium]
MTKLFVGGLPYSVDNNKLNEMFAAFGEVSSAVVIMDKFTNQSKGFGFVEMTNDADAQKAISALDGQDFEGRRLGVSVAKPREDKPRDGGFSSGNRGGFNNNNRY